MEKRFSKILLIGGLSLIFFLPTAHLEAQYFEENSSRLFDNMSLYLHAGPTLFFGDVHSKSPFQEDWKLGFGLGARKYFSPIFGAGIQFLGANIHGTVLNWPNGDAANLKFDASLVEFNMNATVNFSNAFFGIKPDRTINIYGLAGFGIANWMSTLRSTLNDEIINQYGVSENGTNAWTPVMVFPVGLGVNVNLSPSIGLNLESVYHITNSDKLDSYDTEDGTRDPFLYTSVGLSFKISGSNGAYVTSTTGSTANFEKDLEKQRKYQQRMAEKERRQQLREEEDQARKDRLAENKNAWGRRSSVSGLPKVVEYDPKYSFREEKPVTKKPTQSQIAEELPPSSEILVIDEGKHFITGKQTPLQSNPGDAMLVSGANTGNIDQSTLSSNVIQIPATGTFYTVQIMASQKPASNIADIRLKYYIGKQIFVSNIDGLYRYSAGYFETFEDAAAYASTLKQNGLGDAFVAIYQNGYRLLHRPK